MPTLPKSCAGHPGRHGCDHSVGPIERQENATGCSYHGVNKVTLGDLCIDPKVAEKLVDPFNTVFGRSLLGHGQVAAHLGNP